VYFKVISRAGNEYVLNKLFRVRIDALKPDIEIIGYKVGGGDFGPNKPADITNQDITVYFTILHGSSGVSVSDVTVAGSASLFKPLDFEWDGGDVYCYKFEGNESITVWARSGAGLQSEAAVLFVDNINKVPPVIYGVTKNGEISFIDQPVHILNRNITIDIGNLANLKNVTVYRNNQEIDIFDPVTGKAVFSKNGAYRIVVTDLAGNDEVAQFYIQKPNLGVIISMPVMGAIILAAFVFLSFITAKRGKALKRLTVNTAYDDSKVGFMMMKVIK